MLFCNLQNMDHVENLDKSCFLNDSNNFRFSKILLCNMNSDAVKMIPTVIINNLQSLTRYPEELKISRISTSYFQNILTVDANKYPEYSNDAIDDKLLICKVPNPDLIINAIDKHEAMLHDLHKELMNFSEFEAKDPVIKEYFQMKLNAFMRMYLIRRYHGRGIFWSDANYDTRGKDPVLDNENLEQSTHDQLCYEIKSQLLPMAYVHKFDPELESKMMDIIKFAYINYFDQSDWIHMSHFAPLLRYNPTISASSLAPLIAAEFRAIKSEEIIDNNSSFIFNNELIDLASKIPDNHSVKRTHSTSDALNNLRYYVGKYLDSLDLSKSFITGSAITAALFKCKVNKLPNHPKIEVPAQDIIDIHFPILLTEMSPEDKKLAITRGPASLKINIRSETEGDILIVTQTEMKEIKFKISTGSDVDIVVDNTVSDYEYRAIANDHYRKILQFYPYAKIKESNKSDGDWNYYIYTDDPLYLNYFRTVEIYRSSFRNICCHHVGSVRGCYTARFSELPQFYLTASAMYTAIMGVSPNYHYFSGKKSKPQDVLIKNMQRGFFPENKAIDKVIREYMRLKGIKLSFLPFYKGENVPYSIFASSKEYYYLK